jgi:hypothetical protein
MKTFWDYPETLEKHTTNIIRVERVKHNGQLILTHRESGYNHRYTGFTIQEAKRLFKDMLKVKGYI